ncbi:uncharacterized protein [Panulirus ornatus]|uniref:uncharacterized protein n=1 Tax=Panulirus ornatus TaxID=150431 RepID=UPI003A88E4F4
MRVPQTNNLPPDKLPSIVSQAYQPQPAHLPYCKISVEKVRVVASYQFRYFILDTWLRTRRWYLVCITYDSIQRRVSAFLNGRLIGAKILAEVDPAWATSLTVGYIDPAVIPGKSFIGNVTSFNLWDHILTSDQLMTLAQCQEVQEGNIVSWRGKWELKNVVEYDVELKDLCYRIPPQGFQVFMPMAYNEGSYICEAIGGILKTPMTFGEVDEIYLKVLKNRSECFLAWVGVTYQILEREWTYHHNGSVAANLPWAFDEPNGLIYENCGGLDVDGIIDDNCNSKRCPICAVAAEVSFTLRGSCEKFVHNMNYMMTNQEDELRFIGYGDYLIFYNGSRWVWTNHKTNVTIAEMVPSRFNYPTGRQQWLLHQPVCTEEEGTVRPFLLTVCPDSHFTCDDGTCITLRRRCDLQYDCRDHSDEAECQLVRLPLDYKSTVAPRPRHTDQGPLKVTAEVTLENLHVDTPGMLVKAAFNLSLSWMESRATYINLKVDLGLNQVDRNQTRLWYPGVAFLNTVDNEVTVIDQHTRTNVLRHTAHEERDMSLAQEVLLYPGWGNPLVSYRKYLSSFTCDFDLTRYPFDRQQCYLLLQLSSAARDNLGWNEKASWVKYKGSLMLLEYTVGHITLASNSGGSILKVQVPLTRRFGYAVINFYIPSLIMATVGYLSLFFLKENFDTRVMTSLTALLVLATISNQVATSLPKSSNFKLVDVWLVFCMVSLFLIIGFHVVIDLLLCAENERRPGRNTVLVSESRLRTRLDEDDSKTQRMQQGHPAESLLSKSLCGALKSKIPKREEDVANVIFHRRSLGAKRSGFHVSVLGMEKFARIFVAAVFLIFNIVYWLKAYSMG